MSIRVRRSARQRDDARSRPTGRVVGRTMLASLPRLRFSAVVAANLGSRVALAALAATIERMAPTHDGLTISGGEPFEQAAALACLVTRLRTSAPTLDVMIYSGYSIDEVRGGSPAQRRLLSLTDLLVDGRFERDAPTNLRWRGSANQRVHLLTSRARRHAALIDAAEASRPIQVMLVGGELHLVGIPQSGAAVSLRAAWHATVVE